MCLNKHTRTFKLKWGMMPFKIVPWGSDTLSQYIKATLVENLLAVSWGPVDLIWISLLVSSHIWKGQIWVFKIAKSHLKLRLMNYSAFWINNGKESKNSETCVCIYVCHNWKSIPKMLAQKWPLWKTTLSGYVKQGVFIIIEIVSQWCW